MAKADQAVVSAKLLLEAGDVDGACNRAYYAMFDAARAALLTSRSNVQPEIARTHNGLITAFSLNLVKTKRVPIELGKALNRAEELRLIADYKGDSVEPEDAARSVLEAQEFVRSMRSLFMQETPR